MQSAASYSFNKICNFVRSFLTTIQLDGHNLCLLPPSPSHAVIRTHKLNPNLPDTMGGYCSGTIGPFENTPGEERLQLAVVVKAGSQ